MSVPLEEKVYGIQSNVEYLMKTHDDFKQMLTGLCMDVKVISKEIHGITETKAKLVMLDERTVIIEKRITDLEKTVWRFSGGMALLILLGQWALNFVK